MAKVHRVYVLKRADGLVKIGTTTDLPGRMHSLATSHGPLEIVRVLNGDAKLERRLHHQFRHRHQFGEWFRIDAEMHDELARIASGEEVLVTVSEARAEWERSEAALAMAAADKVNKLVAYRCGRKGLTRGEAMAEVSADYGLPVSFLIHLQKRKATTVSAHGLAAIRSALIQEMQQYAAEIQAEMEDAAIDALTPHS